MEDFSKMSQKDLEKAPKISFDKTAFKFDTVAQNTAVNETIKITNNGRTPLIIRKIDSSMPALSYRMSAMEIAPGQSANLELTFKAQNRRGKQNATVEVISNSPSNPSQIISVTGVVIQ